SLVSGFSLTSFVSFASLASLASFLSWAVRAGTTRPNVSSSMSQRKLRITIRPPRDGTAPLLPAGFYHPRGRGFWARPPEAARSPRIGLRFGRESSTRAVRARGARGGHLLPNAQPDRRTRVADFHDEVDRHVRQHADRHVLD